MIYGDWPILQYIQQVGVSFDTVVRTPTSIVGISSYSYSMMYDGRWFCAATKRIDINKKTARSVLLVSTVLAESSGGSSSTVVV